MVDLSQYDFEAIVDQTDKLHEAAYFLEAARQQAERREFRWLVSAFLNAAYSYFDTAALHACNAYMGEDGITRRDDGAIEVLKKYIEIKQGEDNPFWVRTKSVHPLVKSLYEHRKGNTHYFPMSIMVTGPLPEDFHFGSDRRKGIPVIPLCVDIMNLMVQVQNELDAAWSV
jgi:hypothetical protein